MTFRDGDDPSDDQLSKVEYGYDAFDRRIYITHRDAADAIYQQARFIYDGWDVVVESYAYTEWAVGHITYANLWVPDGESSLLLAQELRYGSITIENTRWMFSDAQQTTRDIVKASNSDGTSLLEASFGKRHDLVFDRDWFGRQARPRYFGLTSNSLLRPMFSLSRSRIICQLESRELHLFS